jgi:hypothetical protein
MNQEKFQRYFQQYRHEHLRGLVENIMQSRDRNTVTKKKEVKK